MTTPRQVTDAMPFKPGQNVLIDATVLGIPGCPPNYTDLSIVRYLFADKRVRTESVRVPNFVIHAAPASEKT